MSYMLKSNKIKINREKQRAFECGFDPEHNFRGSFSLRFFIITIVFLIFDVEITALFPAPSIERRFYFWRFLWVNSYLFLVLLLGLVFEWSQGALEWR